MRFYAFDSLGYFRVTERNFMNFMIFGDSIVHRQCMGFHSLGGLRVSYRVISFLGKLKFLFSFMLSIFFFGFLWVRDGRFMNFVILGDSIALSRCMGFWSLGSLYWKKTDFAAEDLAQVYNKIV